jgi:Cu(I)/Ag(I) efflux system membrane protein CusA/SilA
MIAKIIEYSIRNKYLVLLVWAGIAVWGLYAVIHTPVDAIPDLSENQVIVFTDWMGRSPQDIEDQITYPLSVQLQNLAGVKSVRASSEFNFSMINVIFDDKTDFYFARQRVLEKLTALQSKMPAGVTPQMAPDATALGQIFWYTVEGGGKSIDELRAIQDFVVRYQLNSIPGVAEVATVGGLAREYQVDVDPAKLRVYDLPLSALYAAIAKSNMSVGGKVVVQNNSEYLVRGVGWLQGVKDLENVVVTSRQGVPIRVKDVAAVQLGPEFRRSALEKNGQEAVGGVVMMRYGQNPLEITQAIKQKIRDMQSGLPEGVRVVPFYDRTRLIESAIHTVTGTLREEIIIASIAILLLLSHFRSAVVVCITLPMAVLVSFLFMYYLNMPSNIMSLSGIAISIGILVDAAVVMVENATHELKEKFGDQKVRGDTTEVVIHACRLVGTPIFFSVIIMLLSFLPVFTFGGQEGKLSHPLAFTKTFAMIGVALLAITFVPALIPLLIKGRLRSEEENWIVRSFIHIYKPFLSWMMDRPSVVWWIMAVILTLGGGFVGSSVVSALVLGIGIMFVVLGVRQSGWTIWLVVAALITLVTMMAMRVNPSTVNHLPIAIRHGFPWLVLAAVSVIVGLAMFLKHWRTAAVASLLLIAFFADTRFVKLGGEFMPELNEGSIMDMPLTAPRIALGQAVDDVMVRDRLLRSFPEVEQAVGKVGRADTATDPSPTDMVETVVSMRPKAWWPKRKVQFDDALKQAGVIAAEMQRRGWLKGDILRGDTWAIVVQAVTDTNLAKEKSHLAPAVDLINTATQVSVDKFDRAMRDLATRRQVEYEPEVGRQLVGITYTSLVAHARSLPARDGKPALMREPVQEDETAAIASARSEGVSLARLPRPEEADHLLATLRAELIRRGLLGNRDDLLLDAPSTLRDSLNFVRKAIGSEAPGFPDRVFAEIEQHRDALWAKRMKTLDWELFDQATLVLNDNLADALHRSALGTPMAGADPGTTGVSDLRDQLRPVLAKDLFLWQKDKGDLVKEMDSELQMPGWGNVWTQPIINRVNMLATGVRTQIGVKVFGPTGKPLPEAIADIQKVSEQIAEKLRSINGAVDVQPDQSVGKRYLEVYIDRDKAARYGVNMSDISEAIETAMGGGNVTTTIEGRQRFPVRLRYARDYWQDLDSIKDVLVTGTTTPAEMLNPGNSGGGRTAPAMPQTGSGAGGNMGGGGAAASGMGGGSAGGSPGGTLTTGMGTGAAATGATASGGVDIKSVQPPSSSGMLQIPLRMVADIRTVEGPSMVKSENGRLRSYVTLNVRGRDIVGFVDEARQAVKSIEKDLAGTGMTIEWAGEFEAQLRARQTLAVIFPMVIAMIFLLLYMTFRDVMDMLLMALAVPGALAGAVMFQALFGFNFSVVVSIGYVAAFGMATQTGVIMLTYLREAIQRRGGLEDIPSLAELRRAVIDGAVHRLRPKLLTEGVAIIGLVPMLWATGTGAEIMRPMAAPVLGGLLISDEVIDIMIPVLFYWIRRRRWLKLHKQHSIEVQPAASGSGNGKLATA